jgi:hypothetical protein
VNNLQRAFYYLLALVRSGTEFPTAHERTVLKFKLTSRQAAALITLYDAEE